MKLLIENWRKFMSEEKDTKTSCKVLIMDDEGKVFIVRMANFGDMWDVPGGHAHHDESHKQAAVREVKEETNLDIHELTKLGEYDTMAHYADKHIFFLCRKWSGDVRLQMKEVDKAEWVDPRNMDDRKLSPEIKRSFEMLLARG
jgi:mutator protein MutT